jgi:transcriptional regulator with XRE-family HTH domain
LEDREYRRQFFWAETSAGIARDLIKLRKLRGHSQKQLADLTGTKQPAISRIEQADYENWNLRTLRTIADAADSGDVARSFRDYVARCSDMMSPG